MPPTPANWFCCTRGSGNLFDLCGGCLWAHRKQAVVIYNVILRVRGLRRCSWICLRTQTRPSRRYIVQQIKNMETIYAGRKYTHHHRPGVCGAAPGVPDKTLGRKMAGAVVVEKTPGPGGAVILSTSTAPAILRPKILSGTPGAAPKAPRAAMVVDISRPRRYRGRCEVLGHGWP